MAKKVQLPVIGGIRKVITLPDDKPAGTTIKEIGANTITIAQLRALLGLTTPTGGGSGTSAPVAALVPGPGLSGGGVLVGAVGIRLTAPIPALLYEGDAGEDGMIGPPGRDGRIGVDGKAGPAVYMLGEDGLDGDIGPPGARGATGAAGSPGIAGPPGQPGDDGADGDSGPPGPRGLTGSQGVQGVSGAAVYMVADDGEDGERGAPGSAGPQGPTGATGPAGPAVCFLDDLLPDDSSIWVPGGGSSLPGGGTTAQFLRGDKAWANTLLGTFEVNGSANLAAAYGPAMGFATNIGGANQTIFFGDGSGYIFTLASRVGSVTTQWLTYNDTGHAVFHSPTTGITVQVNAVTGGSSGLVVTDGTVSIDHFFGTGVGLFGTSSNHPFRIVTNSSPRIIISAAGAVQVGPPTGTATALNVRGTGNIEVATFQADSGNATYIGLIDGQVGNGEWLIASGLVSAGTFAIFSGATGAAQLFCGSNGAWTMAAATGAGTLTIQQTNGNNALLIATTGFDATAVIQTTTAGNAVMNFVTLGVTAMSFGNRRSDGALVLAAGTALATPKVVFASAGSVTFTNAIGVNGSAPPAKVTGWGTPASPSVVATFPASPTLAQCGSAIGKIIADLKNLGFYGA